MGGARPQERREAPPVGSTLESASSAWESTSSRDVHQWSWSSEGAAARGEGVSRRQLEARSAVPLAEGVVEARAGQEVLEVMEVLRELEAEALI
eukprot:378869-Prorocentrum_minimum.AAC.1